MKNYTLSNVVKCGLVAMTALQLFACGDDPAPAAPSTTTYTQVERLARPAINEGLIITNSNLNLWNSVPPSADLSTAGAGIVTEAGSTLTAINTYATGQGLTPPSVAQVVGGFLPDVMRIDTTKAFAGNPSDVTNVTDGTMAYAGCLSATKLVLCGGRKLRDNVTQITVNYLADGLSATDNLAGVPYNPGAESPKGVLAGFPYAAAPY